MNETTKPNPEQTDIKRDSRKRRMPRVASSLARTIRGIGERDRAFAETNRKLQEGPALIAAAREESEKAPGQFGKLAQSVAILIQRQDAAAKIANPNLVITPNGGSLQNNEQQYIALDSSLVMASEQPSLDGKPVAGKAELNGSPLRNDVKLQSIDVSRTTAVDLGQEQASSDSFTIRFKGRGTYGPVPPHFADTLTVSRGADGELVLSGQSKVTPYKGESNSMVTEFSPEQAAAAIEYVANVAEQLTQPA